MTDMLKRGEYIGHEGYFPNRDVSQETIDLLKGYGFCESGDGFYIPTESLKMFKLLASPYKVDIMQDNIILGGDPEGTINQLLDMVNALKAAGAGGVENFIAKIGRPTS